MNDINILCVTTSKDTLSINTSTMVLNKTIIEGLSKLGYKIDLVTLDFYGDKDITNNKMINMLNDIFLMKVKRVEQVCKSGVIDNRKNYFITIKSKLYSFIHSTLKDIISPNYYKKDLKKILCDEQYDLILTLCPPASSPFLTRYLIKYNKNLKGIKWIQYWSDSITASLLDFETKIPRKRYLHKIIEDRCFRKADEIVYCTPLLCEIQKKIHPQHANKMRWVDVGYVSEYYREKSNKDKNNIISVGYFGAYQKKIRNILPLLRTIGKIKNLRLDVYGDTDLKDLKYNNVKVSLGRIPYEDIKKLEQDSDILVCICNRSGVQIPGKIFYYASYNKPIIVILDGKYKEQIYEYLSGLNRYILCANDEESIVEAINKAISVFTNYNVEIPERLKPDIVAKSIISSGGSVLEF